MGQDIVIDGRPFNNQELINNYRNLFEVDSSISDKKEQIIEDFINEKLKLVDALNSSISEDPEFQEEFNSFRKELADPYLLDNEKLDFMIRQAYDRMKSELNVSQILVKLPKNPSSGDTLLANNKIQKIYQYLINGSSFEDIALKYSEDELTASKRGNLGYLTALQTEYSFEDQMYSLQEGQYSSPFRTQAGYHIIKLNSIRPNSGKIRLAHILVSIGSDAEESANKEAKDKIDQINQYLLKGETFESVCKNFSEDPYSRGRGGEIRKWYFTSDLDEFLQEKLFTLKDTGEVTAPIRTNLGWHIFKLIDKKPLLPFEELEEFIKRKILSDDSRFNQIKESFIRKNSELYGLKIHENNKRIAFDRYNSDRMGNELFLQEPLIVFNNQTRKIKSFYDFIIGQQKIRFQREGTVPHLMLDAWFDLFLNSSILQQVEKDLEEINPEFKASLKEFYEASLLSKMTDSLVFAPSLDESNILTFFNENSDKFILNKHFVGKLISSDNENTLKEVVEELSKSPYPSNKHFPDIVYDLNSIQWNENGKILFDELTNYMLSNPDNVLEIISYRDNSEPEDISFKRMNKLVELLGEQSIEITRIIEKDMGSLDPISKTNANRNSRISFKFYTSSKEDLLLRYNYIRPNSVIYNEGDLYFSEFPELENVKILKGITNFESNNRFYFLNLEKIEEERLMDIEEAKVEIIKVLQDKFASDWLKHC
ncbi:MAG: Peptidylprolyl isomerase, partial [Bacteroidota bacterium]